MKGVLICPIRKRRRRSCIPRTSSRRRRRTAKPVHDTYMCRALRRRRRPRHVPLGAVHSLVYGAGLVVIHERPGVQADLRPVTDVIL